MGCLTGMGEFTPLGKGDLLNLHWDPAVLLQARLLKCATAGMKHAPLKEGRRWGFWRHILPPVHLLTLNSAASPGQYVWYVQPGQVPKATNLPLLQARWAHSVFYWYNHLATIFVPSIGLEDIIAYRKALTNFTQQALNDSLQSLSLPITEISFMRKAVLQNRRALTLLLPHKGTQEINGSDYGALHRENCYLFWESS